MSLQGDCEYGAARRPSAPSSDALAAARSGGWERAVPHGHVPEHPTPQAAGTEYSALDIEDVLAAGPRPDRLACVRPQERTQRRTVEQTFEAPLLLTLDSPAPLMVEHLVDVHQFFEALVLVAEQVVEVPKIILENIPVRTLVREPQLAEQLVKVPTILTHSFIRMLQNVDTPVPHGGRGASGGLQGFLPGRSSSFTVEQTVDIPAPRGGGRRLQDFSQNRVQQRRLSSRTLTFQFLLKVFKVQSSSHSPAGFVDDAFEGFFRTFPQVQKSATLPPHFGSELPPHSSPRTPAACDVPIALEEEESESESEELDYDVEYVEFDGRWWECEWVPARQQYCWWFSAADGSQIGHTVWRPPWLIGSGPG